MASLEGRMYDTNVVTISRGKFAYSRTYAVSAVTSRMYAVTLVQELGKSHGDR